MYVPLGKPLDTPFQHVAERGVPKYNSEGDQRVCSVHAFNSRSAVALSQRRDDIRITEVEKQVKLSYGETKDV